MHLKPLLCSPSRVLGRADSTCRVISCCPRLRGCRFCHCCAFVTSLHEAEVGRRAKRDYQRMEHVFVGEDEKSLAGLAIEGSKLKAERR